MQRGAAGHRRAFIARGKVTAHRAAMVAALSPLHCSWFRICTITGPGMAASCISAGRDGAALYLTILTSHTILAIVVVPLVLITLTRGLRGQLTGIEPSRAGRSQFGFTYRSRA